MVRYESAAAFGMDLYRVLAEDSVDVVFSPFSVAGALRMAWYGARGQTAAELARALHLQDAAAPGGAGDPGDVPDPVPPGYGSAVFRAPNTAWIQSGFAISAEYRAQLSHLNRAMLASADFTAAPEQARAEINEAIAGQTEGKITGLLPPGSVGTLTRLVLASAVYLKAEWGTPFPVDKTHDAPFYPDGPDRPGMTIPIMRGTATRDYLRGDGYQAVLLSYAGTSLAMAVVLPDGPLRDLRPKAAAAGLAGLLAGAASYEVDLALPRFRLAANFDLGQALQRLGVVRAFGHEADFSGITVAGPLWIGAVAHQAYIDVDEHGTEAAAATAMALFGATAFRAPPPVTMVVDRPFLFAILDRATGVPVFLGQVSQPRSA
ncbi:MAG: serpin family protein [Streptosporangiaceae bacterium]|jgi:serpin B